MLVLDSSRPEGNIVLVRTRLFAKSSLKLPELRDKESSRPGKLRSADKGEGGGDKERVVT